MYMQINSAMSAIDVFLQFMILLKSGLSTLYTNTDQHAHCIVKSLSILTRALAIVYLSQILIYIPIIYSHDIYS